MHASLPMYDRAELRPATDAFWALSRDALRARGLDAPDALTRGAASPWDLWTSPDLLLSQTCGLPLRARLHEAVQLVCTPDFGLPGCPFGHYSSVLVTRRDLADTPLDRLLPRPAANEALSQSGWGALCAHAARHGLTPRRPILTGGHAASARAVLEGRADLAAIDAQTWRLLQRHEPDLAALHEYARTAPTPALPLITAKGRDPAPILAALEAALAALPEHHRAALGLRGFARLPLGDYRALVIPPDPRDLPE
ncbi:MAG: PhnD/SsuA/transferrin family substrate-binding protein [Nioella sp.]